MRPRDRRSPQSLLDLSREWVVTQRGRAAPVTESLLTVANGYLGWRGIPDEGEPAAYRGAYVNGLFESWPLVHAELAQGLTSEGQMMVPVTEGQLVSLFVDGELVEPDGSGVERLERRLDLRAGVLERELLYRTRAGRRLRISSTRLVSLVRRHLGIVRYEVVPLNGPVQLELIARLAVPEPQHEIGVVRRDDVTTLPSPGILCPLFHRAAGTRLTLAHRTAHSRHPVVCIAEHRVEHPAAVTQRTVAGPRQASLIVQADARRGVTLRLTKFVAYNSAPAETAPEELAASAELDLDAAVSAGIETLLAEHRARLDRFWEVADIRLRPTRGSEAVAGELQAALRFNLFHVLQATACLNGMAMPAMGVTSNAYQGHTMWDMDAYVIPFLCCSCPELARPLVGFRHATLEEARRRGRTLGLRRGATYPWRTIEGGEASAFFPAAGAQVHVNAAVARGAYRYAHAAGDREWMLGPMAEILVETARTWTEALRSDRSDGGASCHAVTGPDEFTTIVDDDFYTNVCARENLRMAAEVVDRLEREDPGALARLRERTAFEQAEAGAWRELSERIVLRFDRSSGTYAQDATFLDKPTWDFESTRPEDFPLYDHFHPLVLYRHQLLKQPSVVQAMIDHREDFDEQELRAAFAYYDPLTAGESTLSLPVQAVAAHLAGEHELALHYMRMALLVDLADVHGSTARGLHIGAMAGAWQVAVRAMAGYSDQGGDVRLRPSLPPEVRGLSFCLHVAGARVRVELGPETARFTLESGEQARLWCGRTPVRLDGEQRVADVAPAPARVPP